MKKIIKLAELAYHLLFAICSPPPQDYIDELCAHHVETTRHEDANRWLEERGQCR